jgi:hypothetical protein
VVPVGGHLALFLVEDLENGFDLLLGDYAAKPDVVSALFGDGDLQVTSAKTEDEVFLSFSFDAPCLYLLDDPGSVMRINNFVTNVEHCSASPFRLKLVYIKAASAQNTAIKTPRGIFTCFLTENFSFFAKMKLGYVNTKRL